MSLEEIIKTLEANNNVSYTKQILQLLEELKRRREKDNKLSAWFDKEEEFYE